MWNVGHGSILWSFNVWGLPSGQPTPSLASSFEQRKYPAAQMRSLLSTQDLPATGAGGIWGKSRGNGAGPETSATNRPLRLKVPRWILGSRSSTLPLNLRFPRLSSTQQMKTQVFNIFRPKALNHLWLISVSLILVWKSIITYCQLCFQIGARIWSLFTTSTVTTLVQVTIVSCPDYWSGFVTIFTVSGLIPSLFFSEYSEWSFAHVRPFCAQNPLLVSHFRIQTPYHGLQKPFTISWPFFLLFSPLLTWFDPYWSFSCSFNTACLLLPQDLCTSLFPLPEMLLLQTLAQSFHSVKIQMSV